MEQIEKTLLSIKKQIAAQGKVSVPALVRAMEPVFQQAGYRDAEDSPLREILVVRLDAIGDNVLTSAFLRELRRSYPTARITLVVSPVVYPLVELCPYVNEVLAFKGHGQGKFLDRFQMAIDFCRDHLWARHFYLALCPRWDFDKYFALFLLYLSGARKRIGYSAKLYEGKARLNEGFDSFLTQAVRNPPSTVHEAERNFFLLNALGAKVQQRHMELWFDERDRLTAKKLLAPLLASAASSASPSADSPPLIAVGFGAGENCRRYPADMLVAALEPLLRLGACFALLGGPNDKADGDRLAAMFPQGKALNLAGRTTLRESAAVLAKSRLYVGNETGTMHMAAALSLPIVETCREALDCKKTFISAYERFYPWQAPAIVLRPPHALGDCAKRVSHGGCIASEPHCIKEIKPSDVTAACETMLQVGYRW